MNWFERITGFAEQDYVTTQSMLRVEGTHLVSAHSDRRWAIGCFETPSLAELRHRAAESAVEAASRTKFSTHVGDVRLLHIDPRHAGALFQVASQFNALEMVGPSITPEHGVTRYADDPTQGPACAIAAGAATIWRNYLVPVQGGTGQTKDRQIDTLHDLGQALGNRNAVHWAMRNGYALCTEAGLAHVERTLAGMGDDDRERLKGMLRIGLQWDADVTSSPTPLTVSQAFCSALPCAYSRIDLSRWESFARLVLEAAYEATLLAGVINRYRTGNPLVYLTRLGGGAFGNSDRWIFESIRHTLHRYGDCGLDVRLVSHGRVASEYRVLEQHG